MLKFMENRKVTRNTNNCLTSHMKHANKTGEFFSCMPLVPVQILSKIMIKFYTNQSEKYLVVHENNHLSHAHRKGPLL